MYLNIFHPLVNPGLRFFLNMAPYSNDVSYCPISSWKILDTFNDQFPWKCQKNPNFWHLIPLNPQIKFFPKMAPHSNDAPYRLLPPRKKLKLLMNSFGANVQNPNFWHLIPLNPRIKIFPKYGTTFKWCPLLPSTIMQKIRNF